MADKSYQVVLSGIEADLRSGTLSVGQKLAGERALAERFAVSRSSVREAVRILEALGVVRTGVGSGPDAGAVITAEPASPIAAALTWHLASRHLPVSDIVGARLLIERWAVREAADGAHGAALDAAGALIEAMDDESLGAAAYLALDTRFHVSLAEAAGNVVIAAVMSAMRTAIEAYVTAAVGRIDDWPAMARRLTAEHRDVLAAVRGGRGADAEAAVCAHITGFYQAAGLPGGG